MDRNRLDRFLQIVQGGLIALAVGVGALFFMPSAYEQFVRPKVVWAEGLAVLIVFWAGVRAVSGRRVLMPVHGMNLLILLYIAWNLLMWPLASSRSLAGEQVAWLLAVGVISWGWQEWAGGKLERVWKMGAILSAAGAITALWALLQDAAAKSTGGLGIGAGVGAWVRDYMPMTANKLGDWRGDITAGFGNTDHIAAFLAVIYLPALVLMLRCRRGWLAGLLMAALWAMAGAMIVCWSVGANGSLMLGAAILSLAMGHARRREIWRESRGRLLAWLAGCAVVVAWLVTNNPLNPHAPGIFQEAFGSSRWIAGGPTRGVIWLNALEMIREHQLLGVGPGCFTYVFPRMQSLFIPNDPSWLAYQGMYTNAAHNALLQAWAELGPVGALILVAMVFAAFHALLLSAKQGEGNAREKKAGHRAENGAERREKHEMAGRSRADVSWTAWAGIGALAVWCGTSMMTFPLQLPVSTILFFCLLPLGEMLLNRTRDENGFEMPPLVLQNDWGEWAIYLQGMNRMVAFGGAFDFGWRRFGRVIAGGIIVALAIGAGWMMMEVTRPLRADLVYRQAHDRMLMQDAKGADALYQRALAMYPDHSDCRSEYSEFLVRNGQYKEALEQLALVFKRLDSPELYLRRARALEGLGRKREAAQDERIYLERVPMARMAQENQAAK